MTVSLFDLRRMDFARKLPERARLMRDDMLRADAAVAAVTAATAAPSADPLTRRHPRDVKDARRRAPTDVPNKHDNRLTIPSLLALGTRP